MNMQKGFLNGSVNDEFLKSEKNTGVFKIFIDRVLSIANPGRTSFCEISHYFSSSSSDMTGDFKNGTFISDDPYESLLTYHYSVIKNKSLNVYNCHFNPGSLDELKMNESIDFIFSIFGLSYEKIFSFLPDMIGLLKVGGIIALEIPAYWFFRDDLSADESVILDYSMKNDKKWIFSEPIEPVINESGAELVSLTKLDDSKTVDRLELSYISSLNKLHKAHVENNIGVLEVANIPEKNINLQKALLVIRKKERTLTKDNLFNI
jgi:hypothetical protein